MNLKEVPTRELVEELKKRNLGVFPLNISFEYRNPTEKAESLTQKQ